MASDREIAAYLRGKGAGRGFADALKISFRPLICPFADLLDFVRPGERACDIGCGSGQFALLLSRFAPIREVLGLEMSERLVNNARALFAAESPARSYAFELYDGRHLPERLEEYDILFLVDVLHHIPHQHQQDFLNEIFVHMRPGARLILKDIDAASPLVLVNKLHDLLFSWTLGSERSLRTATEMVRRAGFRVVDSFRRVRRLYPHYFVVVVKDA